MELDMEPLMVEIEVVSMRNMRWLASEHHLFVNQINAIIPRVACCTLNPASYSR